MTQPSVSPTPFAVRSLVRSVATQRRCFLIDSLLEERQKRLAATVAAKREANAFNPEGPKMGKEEIGKETTMPDLQHMEEEETTNEGGNGVEDGEETTSEEVLPTFEEDKKEALLEALVKLVPEAVGQRGEAEEQRNGRRGGSAEEDERSEGGDTPMCQAKVSAEQLLHKFILFQQQMASSTAAAAAAGGWTFMSPLPSPITSNFLRFPPLFAAPSFSLLNDNSPTNRMPKCFASSNQWRQLMPILSMSSTPKWRIKAPNAEVRNGGTPQVNNNINNSEWMLPNRSNMTNGPTSAIFAGIGAFQAATAATCSTSSSMSGPNNGTNTNRKDANANETKIGRRPSAIGTQQRQRHGQSGGGARSTRSSNLKKYRCDICDKTFSRSNTLITHKRIHTGEKPFRCEHCGRAFRQPGNLTRHAYTHTTVKPFVCAECGKAFNRASNLHSHVRVHSAIAAKSSENLGGVGLKQCKRCQSAFETRSELRAHRC